MLTSDIYKIKISRKNDQLRSLVFRVCFFKDDELEQIEKIFSVDAKTNDALNVANYVWDSEQRFAFSFATCKAECTLITQDGNEIALKPKIIEDYFGYEELENVQHSKSVNCGYVILCEEAAQSEYCIDDEQMWRIGDEFESDKFALAKVDYWGVFNELNATICSGVSLDFAFYDEAKIPISFARSNYLLKAYLFASDGSLLFTVGRMKKPLFCSGGVQCSSVNAAIKRLKMTR